VPGVEVAGLHELVGNALVLKEEKERFDKTISNIQTRQGVRGVPEASIVEPDFSLLLRPHPQEGAVFSMQVREGFWSICLKRLLLGLR
jgi:hypothetical protein